MYQLLHNHVAFKLWKGYNFLLFFIGHFLALSWESAAAATAATAKKNGGDFLLRQDDYDGFSIHSASTKYPV